MEKLTWGTRLIGKLFGYAPEYSITNMTLEQIERSKGLGADSSPTATRVTRFLLGSLQDGIRVNERTIPGPADELPLAVYVPDHAASGPRPLILHYHGGGWVLGNHRGSDWMCSTVARDVGAIVVSVGYRLAPKHKFPAAIEDCYTALDWCSQEGASLGADPNRIGLMGDSAGANLAAVTALMAKERGGPAIRHVALLYPVTDGSMSTDSFRAGDDAIILSGADMNAFYDHYLPVGTDPLDWRVSPLYAPDLSGLPPMIIVVAGHDPLHDEGVQFAEKLADAGVPVTLEDYPAMPHGFASFPRFSRDAKPAFASITASQRAALLPMAD